MDNVQTVSREECEGAVEWLEVTTPPNRVSLAHEYASTIRAYISQVERERDEARKVATLLEDQLEGIRNA